MEFKKDWLLENVVDGTPVLNEISGHSRWSINYRAVFEFEGKYYKTTYSVGATEMQEEGPYDYAPENIECPEVIKEEYTAIRYIPAKS